MLLVSMLVSPKNILYWFIGNQLILTYQEVLIEFHPHDLKYDVMHSNLHMDSNNAPTKSNLTKHGKLYMQNNDTK